MKLDGWKNCRVQLKEINIMLASKIDTIRVFTYENSVKNVTILYIRDY
jgi:hypothetical protein